MSETSTPPVTNVQSTPADTGAKAPAVDKVIPTPITDKPLFSGEDGLKVQETKTSAGKSEQKETPAEKPVEKLTPAEKKKYKLKLEGKDTEFEVSEDDVPRYLQKGLTADKRLEEIALERKKLAAEREEWKKDPFKVIRDMGLDPDELAAKRVIEQYEDASLTPEQKEARDLKRRLEAAEERLKKVDEVEQKKAQEAKAQEYADRYSKELDAIIDSGVLPSSPGAISSIIEAFRDRQASLTDPEAAEMLSVQDILPDVIEGYQNELKEGIKFYAGKPEELKRILGPEVFKILRDMDIAEFKAKGGRPVVEPNLAAPTEEQPKTLSDFKSWKEFSEYLAQKK